MGWRKGEFWGGWAKVKGGRRAHPSLFRSRTLGNITCTYADVQIIRRMTRRSDWKLKIAV